LLIFVSFGANGKLSFSAKVGDFIEEIRNGTARVSDSLCYLIMGMAGQPEVGFQTL
jgi:hypothetical protein